MPAWTGSRPETLPRPAALLTEHPQHHGPAGGARDDLKHIVDDLEIDGVDRRSVDGMRAALSRARRAKPEDLLGYMRKDQIKEVCRVMGVSPKGKRTN